MEALDTLAAIQVGNGPCHPQNTVIAPGGKAHPLEGPLHQPLAVLVQSAEAPQLLLPQLGVAGDARLRTHCLLLVLSEKW